MKVIVSFTTIFDRQKQASYMLNSLLKQRKVPDEIYMYVSEKSHLLDKGIQLYGLNPLLYDIVKKNKCIKVVWVENEGPYRKLLPTLKQFWQQDVIIITCDDDIEYKDTFVEEAVKLYEEKKCCIGFQGTRINNSFVYSSFEDAKDTQSLWNLPKGVGGILYNPKWFSNNSIFKWNKEWTNDDLWFALWRIAAGVECYITKEMSLKNSFQLKENLWGKYNEKKNTSMLEEIYTFLHKEGHLLVKVPEI